MSVLRIIGVALIVLGAVALSYKQFSYTKETHKADIGGLHLSLEEKQQVAIPVWLGGGAVALGIVLLIVPGRKS